MILLSLFGNLELSLLPLQPLFTIGLVEVLFLFLHPRSLLCMCDRGHWVRCARNAWQRLGKHESRGGYWSSINCPCIGESTRGDCKPGSSEVENLVAVTPDLSTFSSRQPTFTDEITLKPVAEEGDPTGGSNLDSRPKNDKHCPAA
ncbi:hypothetical protein NC653_032189 [Populus alba x Populus x berolinensis]|uniref:Uncharacterized protein n=1 Tax=Populus alba x Populus x berolinensis TaxID=444605 RepID=A0AAD6LR95_9ROSI|nr:hypothetical protein NC653_032189 [Populus alba x Populus x berolinensis]